MRAGFRSPAPHRRSSGTPVKLRPSRSKYVPHQGERETARRRRQIERGQLKAENGLHRRVA